MTWRRQAVPFCQGRGYGLGAAELNAGILNGEGSTGGTAKTLPTNLIADKQSYDLAVRCRRSNKAMNSSASSRFSCVSAEYLLAAMVLPSN